MANQYRISRNIEASIIDFLKTNFDIDWSGISVEKTFARIYNQELPSVCIRCGVTAHEKVEIGSTSTKRIPQVLIDIFGSSDGNRLDLKDYIIEKVKGGIVYYDYEIEKGATKTKTESGRISVGDIDDTPVNFDTPKAELDIRDRFRHLITLSISLGKVEA